MSRSRKFIAGTLGPVALLAGAILTAAPAQAAPTICNANTTWATITARTDYLEIDSGDLLVHIAPSTSSMTVTRDFTASATTGATVSTSVGATATVSGGVALFNAEMGLSSTAASAMETSDSYSTTVSQNVTVPAGQRYLQFVGHNKSRATIVRQRCDGTGTYISTYWRGTVDGPRVRAAGFMDCRDTTVYC